MTRTKLSGRRPSTTITMTFKADGKNDIVIGVTYGFEDYLGPVREVFCKPFRVGADMQSLLRQAVMVISLALQRGAMMGELAHVAGEDVLDHAPRSIIGLIIRTGVNLDAERGHVWERSAA